MHFRIKEVLDREICHAASADLLVTSTSNRVYVNRQGHETIVALPDDGWKGAFAHSRLARRALRLDKCNVVPVPKGLVIIRQGKVFHYDEDRRELTHVLSLKNCRNVLHQSIARIDGNRLYFGEYGSNLSRSEVPVYRSLDGGKHWDVVFTFPPGKIKHVHGCYHDPHEDRIWTFTDPAGIEAIAADAAERPIFIAENRHLIDAGRCESPWHDYASSQRARSQRTALGSDSSG